jgi:hypothetical protein
MPTITESEQNYIGQLLKDLNLESLSEVEQQRAIEMLSERFHKVIIITLLKAMSPQQKTRFSAVLDNPKTIDSTVAEIAAEIPSLSKILEEAMLAEYEALKEEMGGK